MLDGDAVVDEDVSKFQFASATDSVDLLQAIGSSVVVVVVVVDVVVVDDEVVVFGARVVVVMPSALVGAIEIKTMLEGVVVVDGSTSSSSG